QMSSLPSEQIKKKIKSVSKVLNIFDGEIDISKNLELKDFKTIDEIREDLVFLENEKKRLEILFNTVIDIEKSQKELSNYKLEIKLVEEKIRKIQEIPNIEKHIVDLEKVHLMLHSEKDELLKSLKALTRNIAKLENQLNETQEELRKLENRLGALKMQKDEVDGIEVEPLMYKTEDDLELIYNKIKLQQADRGDIKSSKDRTFDSLRNKLNNHNADENEFIKFVEEELACVTDKEKSIEGLLQSISTQFANPAFTLIKRYEEFKEFVYHKFNPKLSKTRISDIESLKVDLLDNKKVMSELRRISAIQEISGQMLLEFDQAENLKVLNTYLDTGRKVSFEELFDLDLRITIKGTEKIVDLADQVESDGTDRMIRLVIIMSVINRLAINHYDNRIALFIDEVATIDKQNRPELVKFCKEHHFIPIFAAPDPVPGFNKYYFIFPGKGKINLNEKVNVVFSSPNTKVAEPLKN
ncbi:MAG: coiled-coil domain-containing protein, partial [Bacteroidia bacterium]